MDTHEHTLKNAIVALIAAGIYFLLVYFFVGHDFGIVPGLEWMRDSFGRFAGSRIWMHSVHASALFFAAIPSALLLSLACRDRAIVLAAVAGALVAGASIVPALWIFISTVNPYRGSAIYVHMAIDSIKFVLILMALTWLANKLPSGSARPR